MLDFNKSNYLQGVSSMGGSMRVPNTDSCVEVGVADLEDGSNGLQVRRGSEPTLHQDTLPPQRQVIIFLKYYY